jgi:hypothetical protein
MIPQSWKAIQVFTAEYSSKMYANIAKIRIGTDLANLNEDPKARGMATSSLKPFW